ncbi:hypothetical protein ACWCQ1_48830 [Streptomyces sp. NPDC002144]
MRYRPSSSCSSLMSKCLSPDHARCNGRHWPRLRIALGKPVRTCWEQRFPELAAAAAA